VVVLDLRSDAALAEDPAIIPGAVRAKLEDIRTGNYKLPPNQEVVTYCSCPNEVTAARVALLLQRSGFKKVHPLLGGIEAWREQNYPVTIIAKLETDLDTSDSVFPDVPRSEATTLHG
jgi:rhodanese-related sulfurtransferase